MKSYLKKAKVKIEGLGGEEIEILELSAAKVNEMAGFTKDEQRQDALLFVVKAGVPAWAHEQDADIQNNVSIVALTEIVRAINTLSGLKLTDEELEGLTDAAAGLRKKNSGTNLTESSSSALPPS